MSMMILLSSELAWRMLIIILILDSSWWPDSDKIKYWTLYLDKEHLWQLRWCCWWWWWWSWCYDENFTDPNSVKTPPHVGSISSTTGMVRWLQPSMQVTWSAGNFSMLHFACWPLLCSSSSLALHLQIYFASSTLQIQMSTQQNLPSPHRSGTLSFHRRN